MVQSKKGIAILGSTGSIGTQALEVIAQYPEHFDLHVLTAHSQADLLIEQAKRFQPNSVVITDEDQYEKVRAALWNEGIKVYAGSASLEQIVEMQEIQIVLNALVGFAGLVPTLNAIRHNKHIALANKEVLVVAGELVTKAAKDNQCVILPVDSEHSALFQCLSGERSIIDTVYLTASGGPFRGYSSEQLKQVSPQEALAHPNWKMGKKISIDSATLMNKGFEVIEAKWLFDLRPEQIELLLHPASIVHAMVQFEDGSIKAQMSLPNMQLPIQYALSFPFRWPSNTPKLDFSTFSSLHFEKIERHQHAAIRLAFDAMELGGTAPCVLNAANEVAVELFLEGKIPFLRIVELNEEALLAAPVCQKPQLDDIIAADVTARNWVLEHYK